MFLAGCIPGAKAPAPAAPKSGPRMRELYPAREIALDLTGQRYGHLVPRERVRSGGAGVGVVWLCDCDCGGTREATTRRLNEGHVTACRDCSSGARCEADLVGCTFGLLTVREIHHVARRGRSWACDCVCGEERVASTYELREGLVMCCGEPECKRDVRSMNREETAR